jgi:GATA-binding protein
MAMDWSPARRSRSRKPSGMTFDQHGMPSISFEAQIPFPSTHHPIGLPIHHTSKLRDNHPSTNESSSIAESSGIPIPGGSGLSQGRQSLLSSSLPTRSARSERSAAYETHEMPSSTGFDTSSDPRNLHALSYPNQVSDYDAVAFGPSSLPSYGIHGLSMARSSSERRSFPRHVRKTSFDHTVTKEGAFPGVSGRHQVNGKPLSPDSLVGTKRPADAPHDESMLRADPSNVDGQRRPTIAHEQDQFDRDTSFPSTAFNFAYTPYNDLFGNSMTQPLGSEDLRPPEGQYQQPSHSSVGESAYSSSVDSTTGNTGLSAAAAAASAAMVEGYAQLSAANMAGSDESGLDFRQFIALAYPADDNGAQNPYTHVDPTQILPVDHGDAFQNFHASPSSDGYYPGSFGSGSTASPEANNTSSASTPPSVEGTSIGQTGRIPPRQFVSTKRVASEIQRKKSLTNNDNSILAVESRSSTSTPDITEEDVGHSKGGSEDGDQPPTICTNCQTTNTPLWRRDPEGQPLCTFFFTIIATSRLFILITGNACGLFYVSLPFPSVFAPDLMRPSRNFTAWSAPCR